MYQATTPTHTFNLPFDASGIEKMILTYKQDGKTLIEKTENDVTLTEKKIILTLTQEETNLFSDCPADVQLRCKVGEKVLASQILHISVCESLNREVI